MKTALPPLVDQHATILILGSMPGEQSLKLQEYYGNRGNHFWKLMYDVFDEPFTLDYPQRKQFLKRHAVALWDVLAGCEREGSLDSNIKKEVPNDFGQFFKKYPDIRHVLFSSKAAAAFFDKYAARPSHVTFHILPSPSRANAGKSYAEKLAAWKILATLA